MNHARTLATTALAVALSLAGCADDTPERHLAAAKAFNEKGDRRAASIEAKNALQKNPELGEARLLLGTNLLRDGNAVAAEVELRKAYNAKQPADQVVPDLARAMLMIGQAKKVVDEFGGTRLGKPPADASLQTTLANAYTVLGRAEQSQAALDAALAADPNHAPARLLRAQHVARTDPAGAKAVVGEVLARDPRNADAWKLHGDLLLHADGKTDDALAAYRKALEIDPSHLAAQFALLDELVRLVRTDEAVRQLAEAKKVAPKHPQTRFLEAQLAYQQKNYKLARDLAQQLVQQLPNSPRVLLLAGAAEAQTNGYAQAETYLGKALQQAPDLTMARRLLVATYLRSGQPAKALSTLKETPGGLAGLNPSMYALAGDVYRQNGDLKKAEEYYLKALQNDSDNARKRTALAVTHLAGDKGGGSLDELQAIAASDTGTTADRSLINLYVQRKEFDKALAAVDKLEAKQPDKPDAAWLRGRVLLAKGDRAGARQAFERALTVDPLYFDAAGSLAAMDLADKRPQDARKRFDDLLAKDPKNARALVALAQLAQSRGAPTEEVAQLLNRAVSADPSNVAAHLLLIDLHLGKRDTKQALAAAQAAVAAVPTSVELLTALGRVQQVSGDANQAIATYTKLLRMQPNSPGPHVRLAEAQMATQNRKAAEQSLQKALEIKPDALEAQRGLFMLALDAKRYPDAMKIARTVQEQKPKAPSGYAFEGDVLGRQQNWTGAAAAYRAALERGAGSDTATRLHSALVGAGKTADAEAFAAKWQKDHPSDGIFLAYLGGWAIARKDYAEADKLLRAALDLQPENAEVLNNLAWLSAKMGKGGALAFAEKANRLAPGRAAYMDTLAVLLADSREYPRAIELQRSAVGLQPENAQLRLNLAKIYLKAGDREQARTELQRLAKLGEKSGAQEEVAALLKTL